MKLVIHNPYEVLIYIPYELPWLLDLLAINDKFCLFQWLVLVKGTSQYKDMYVLTQYWLFWHIGCFQKSGGKLAGGYVELGEEVEPTKKKRKVVTRVVKPTVGSQFRAADTSDVQQVMWNECHTIPYHANHRLIFRTFLVFFIILRNTIRRFYYSVWFKQHTWFWNCILCELYMFQNNVYITNGKSLKRQLQPF